MVRCGEAAKRRDGEGVRRRDGDLMSLLIEALIGGGKNGGTKAENKHLQRFESI
jgi:hypothetical protein